MQVGKHIPHSWLCTLDVLNILEGRGGCARVTFGAKYLLHSLNLDMLVLGMRVSQNGPAFPFSSIYSRVWIFRPCKPFLEKKKTHTSASKPERQTRIHNTSLGLQSRGDKVLPAGAKEEKMSEPNPFLSYGNCYYYKDKKSPDDILSCRDAGLGPTHCCQAGDRRYLPRKYLLFEQGVECHVYCWL